MTMEKTDRGENLHISNAKLTNKYVLSEMEQSRWSNLNHFTELVETKTKQKFYI